MENQVFRAVHQSPAYDASMKFNVLRSVGHNTAHSLASGCGFLFGVDGMDVFEEAARSADGFIAVDFLTGTCIGAKPSPTLAHAVVLYRELLAILCVRQKISPSAFKTLTARYWTNYAGVHVGSRFLVTIEDDQGRQAVDEYLGMTGSRVRIVDRLGRLRRK
jgi:hypothetical protein